MQRQKQRGVATSHALLQRPSKRSTSPETSSHDAQRVPSHICIRSHIYSRIKKRIPFAPSYKPSVPLALVSFHLQRPHHPQHTFHQYHTNNNENNNNKDNNKCHISKINCNVINNYHNYKNGHINHLLHHFPERARPLLMDSLLQHESSLPLKQGADVVQA